MCRQKSNFYQVTVRPVRNFKDFWFVRKVRNRCYHYLTGNPHPISILQQILYAFKYALWKNNILLVAETPLHNIVGYGNIVYDAWGYPWLTGCVDPQFQGRGIGRQLFEHMLDGQRRVTYLEVQEGNIRAIRLYESLDFRVIDFKSEQARRGTVQRKEGVLIMRRG